MNDPTTSSSPPIEIPPSFAQGMADINAGRTVPMETALSEKPPFDSGGCAFPSAEDDKYYREPGMSLWDYFAAHALAGYCANPGLNDKMNDAETAEWCANAADALLTERAKRFANNPQPKRGDA